MEKSCVGFLFRVRGATAELLVAHLEGRQKGFLRQFHIAHALHALFAFLLFFQQLAFAGDVAAVAFGGHVLAKGRDRFAGDDLLADSRLNSHLEELARNGALELRARERP